MSETVEKDAASKPGSESSSPMARGQREEPGDGASRLKGALSRLTLAQKIGAVVTLALTFGGLLWIAFSATQVEHRTLYGNLSAAQSAQIVEALQQKQIPYKLEGPGTIPVPAENIHEARIYLAGQGLPEFEGAGFELFDKNEFGMTAFTQKVNYQRAMESELARTIRQIKSIHQARVHLVIPERALFQEDQRQPTASVIVTLRPGSELDPAQIRSIRHLVSGAIEGMDPRDIAVVDAAGAMLAKPRSLDAGAVGGTGLDDSEEVKTAALMERELEERVVELLAPLVGSENVRAKVSVELETRKVTGTAELYDPDKTAVRREQRSEESNQRGEATANGVAGATTQLGNGAANGASTQLNTQRTNEIIDYEVNKRILQTTDVGLRVKRLSVAVLVDDSQPAVASADGADAANATAPNVQLEPAKIEALVRSAVGFDAQRGDQLEVMKERFRPVEQPDMTPLPFWQEPLFLAQAIRYGVLAILALLILMLVVRPVLKTIRDEMAEKPEGAADLPLLAAESGAVGKTVAELEGELEGAKKSPLELVDSNEELAVLLNPSDPLREHQQLMREEVLELSSEDLDRTSQVISQWIRVG